MVYHQLDNEITCIDTAHIRNDFVAVYLIRSGDSLAFVDTGSYWSVPNLLAALETKNLHTRQVKYIFTTHIHLDHSGGAGELIRHCPNAKVVVHEKGAPHLIAPQKLKSSVLNVYGEAFFKQYLGDIVPIAKNKIIAKSTGDFLLGRRVLTLINTPGHARHHYCIYDKDSFGIFSGDTLGVSYSAFNTKKQTLVFPPTSPNQFEPEVWQQSITKLLNYRAKYAYLAHFCRIRLNENVISQLQNNIKAFCQISKNIAKQTKIPSEREHAIKAALMKYLLNRLSHIDLSLSEKQALLKEDVDVSTKGLLIWLDYQN